MKEFIKTADKTVSLYMYGMGILLIIFMSILLLNGAYGFIMNIPDIIEGYRAGGPEETEKFRKSVEARFMHFVAFSIVLVKAYKILMAYAEHHHISIKYIIEISIIASAVEILFNSHSYSLSHLTLFGVFGVVNLIIYVLFYEKVKELDV